ncbi:MAG: sugar transferase [Candidatus Paceibacterota bacterium]
MVVFAIPKESRAALADQLLGIDIGIKVVGLENFYEEIAGKVPLNLIDKFWVMEIIPRTSRKEYVDAKRVFDVFFSFIGLIFTLFIFPFVFLATKLDSRGPILYVQNRKGRGGRIFKFYKFRTMTATSDQYSVWRAGKDEQVTRVGKILKRTHIDEFPQFFNILKGDISFVGPRPEWDKLALEFEKKIPLYRYRYLVRPGFTGWAQINYKASASIKEAQDKFEYDLYYIKNRSFVLDISIIAKTVQLFFR